MIPSTVRSGRPFRPERSAIVWIARSPSAGFTPTELKANSAGEITSIWSGIRIRGEILEVVGDQSAGARDHCGGNDMLVVRIWKSERSLEPPPSRSPPRPGTPHASCR